MQTFLPLPSFAESASVLDNRRLNNQINEALVVWRTLTGCYAPGKGWPHHSTTRMWRGYEKALAYYHDVCLAEYGRRKEGIGKRQAIADCCSFHMPPWFGDPLFHAGHRSNLLRKNPAWYSQFGWTESADLPYVWPVKAVSA